MIANFKKLKPSGVAVFCWDVKFEAAPCLHATRTRNIFKRLEAGLTHNTLLEGRGVPSPCLLHTVLFELFEKLFAGDGSPKYNCVDCSESFGDKQALKAHIASKHTNMLACKGCFMMFQTKEDLAEHDCGYQSIQVQLL